MAEFRRIRAEHEEKLRQRLLSRRLDEIVAKLDLRRDRDDALPSEPLTELIAEDRWIAQRYGVFVFFGARTGTGVRVDIDDYLTDLVEEIADDARALGCEAEMRRALSIVREGAGADRQLDLYGLHRLEGDSHDQALRRVVDLVLKETRETVAGMPG